MKWLGPPRPRTGCCPPGVTLAGFRSKVTPESDLDLVRPLDAFLPLTRLRFTDSLSLSPVRRDTTSFLQQPLPHRVVFEHPLGTLMSSQSLNSPQNCIRPFWFLLLKTMLLAKCLFIQLNKLIGQHYDLILKYQ